MSLCRASLQLGVASALSRLELLDLSETRIADVSAQSTPA
jgi:hypothetical protein